LKRLLAAGGAALLLAILPACTEPTRVPAPTGTGQSPTTAVPDRSTATSADPGTTASTASPGPGNFSFVRMTEDNDDELVVVSYPVLQSPVSPSLGSVNDKISGAVDDVIATFMDAAAAAPEGETRSTLTLEAAPELINDDVFSLSGVFFEFVRGGAPITRRLAWVFSIETGSVVTAAELFVDGSLDHLAAAARDHLVTDVLGDAAAITVPDGLAPTPANYDAVWLTSTGVGVGFDQFQVAGGEVGTPTVHVPFAELLDVLDTGGILAPLQRGSTLPES
jgi:hypothetical protein